MLMFESVEPRTEMTGMKCIISCLTATLGRRKVGYILTSIFKGLLSVWPSKLNNRQRKAGRTTADCSMQRGREETEEVDSKYWGDFAKREGIDHNTCTEY